VGGFDEENLAVAFNDVDFCIKVRQAGYSIVWTPYAEMYHYESISRGNDATPQNAPRAKAEIDYMRRRWATVLDQDPFHNPNLTLDSDSHCFELAKRPRVRKPWLTHPRQQTSNV
jgi:O-antigen biosynthesis protein